VKTFVFLCAGAVVRVTILGGRNISENYTYDTVNDPIGSVIHMGWIVYFMVASFVRWREKTSCIFVENM
jgi:hypothetical protein